MDFEELQKSWRSQPVHIPHESAGVNNQIISQWHKQQRNVLRSNILTTVAFMCVFMVLAWVYISFHTGRTIFFGGSLLFMCLLLAAYLWVMWKGVANKKMDATLSSKEYIDHLIEKLLWRRKTITSYTLIYSILLWLAFMFYCLDITRGGSLMLRIGAPVAITIYIFGMQLIMGKTKQKKQRKQIDQLIADMQGLKTKLVDEAS